MTTNTANRGYQLPNPANFLDEDVLRLISALQAIDADVAAILASLLGKAAAAHGHVINDVAGLQQALDGKQAVGSFGSLGSLSDVSDVAPATNMFLRFSGAEWVPVAFDAAMIAGGTINVARLPSYLASTALSSTYAPLSHTHTVAQISGLGSAATQNVGTAANNIVQLDSGAKLPPVDGSQLTNLPAQSPSGRLLRAPQILTSGTSYTTPAGCNAVYVEVQGGGGGGAGTAFGDGRGGGGAGAYAAKYFAVSPSTAYSYAIGAGGVGESSSVNATQGGSTTFTAGGTTVTAAGGGAGNGYNGGSGGSASNGDLNINGRSGGDVINASDYSGEGGSSYFGFGGKSAITGRSSSGFAGVGYGSGGSGAVAPITSTIRGGNGAPGVIRIWEYA